MSIRVLFTIYINKHLKNNVLIYKKFYSIVYTVLKSIHNITCSWLFAILQTTIYNAGNKRKGSTVYAIRSLLNTHPLITFYTALVAYWRLLHHPQSSCIIMPWSLWRCEHSSPQQVTVPYLSSYQRSNISIEFQQNLWKVEL